MHPTCLSNIGEARVTVAEGMEERVVGAKGSEVMGRLSVCVYMCFHECVCVYLSVCVFLHVYVYIHVSVYVSECLFLCLCVFMSLSMCVCAGLCVCLHAHISVSLYLCSHASLCVLVFMCLCMCVLGGAYISVGGACGGLCKSYSNFGFYSESNGKTLGVFVKRRDIQLKF